MPTGTGMKHLEKAMPTVTLTSASPREHAVDFCGGNATMGFHPVCRDLFHVSPARLRLHPSRRCLQDLPVIFAWIAPDFPRTTARRITVCSTSRICAASRT